MITIVKEFTFDAAHYLPGHKGPCANLHGHTYRLQVGVAALSLNEQGMVMDFGYLKEAVNEEILAFIDHKYLNRMGAQDFPCNQPTAERMVQWIAKRLEPCIPKGTRLAFVRLYETPTSYAEWRLE
jgi:6-pyruvoyltetrahydropterin/6-carboxytetrahydropterin synthase